MIFRKRIAIDGTTGLGWRVLYRLNLCSQQDYDGVEALASSASEDPSRNA